MKTKDTKAKSLNQQKDNKLPPTEWFERGVASIPHQSCQSSSVHLWKQTRKFLFYALLDIQSATTFISKDSADIARQERESKTQSILNNFKSKRGEQQKGARTANKRHQLWHENHTCNNIHQRLHTIKQITYSHKCHSKGLASHRHGADEMSPELDCEIGVLIGYDCPQDLLPRDVIMDDEDQLMHKALHWAGALFAAATLTSTAAMKTKLVWVTASL